MSDRCRIEWGDFRATIEEPRRVGGPWMVRISREGAAATAMVSCSEQDLADLAAVSGMGHVYQVSSGTEGPWAKVGAKGEGCMAGQEPAREYRRGRFGIRLEQVCVEHDRLYFQAEVSSNGRPWVCCDQEGITDLYHLSNATRDAVTNYISEGYELDEDWLRSYEIRETTGRTRPARRSTTDFEHHPAGRAADSHGTREHPRGDEPRTDPLPSSASIPATFEPEREIASEPPSQEPDRERHQPRADPLPSFDSSISGKERQAMSAERQPVYQFSNPRFTVSLFAIGEGDNRTYQLEFLDRELNATLELQGEHATELFNKMQSFSEVTRSVASHYYAYEHMQPARQEPPDRYLDRYREPATEPQPSQSFDVDNRIRYKDRDQGPPEIDR